MYTTILAPLDGSEVAERALPHAQALAVAFDASLVLVRAVSPHAAPALVAPASTAMVHPAGVVDIAALLDGERQEAARYLRATARILAEQGTDVSAEQQDGDPAETILRRARELPAD